MTPCQKNGGDSDSYSIWRRTIILRVTLKPRYNLHTEIKKTGSTTTIPNHFDNNKQTKLFSEYNLKIQQILAAGPTSQGESQQLPAYSWPHIGSEEDTTEVKTRHTGNNLFWGFNIRF